MSRQDGSWPAAGLAVCVAHATQENTDMGGSRFVGRVELRGAGGRVWLRGRRISARRLWARAGGRVAGPIWSVVWRVAVIFTWDWWLWWDGRPSQDTEGQGCDEWGARDGRPETVSWVAARSKLVSVVPTAQRYATPGEAALPALMGVRGVRLDTAARALDRVGATPAMIVTVEVPLGPKGALVDLCLEISEEERADLMTALSGLPTIVARTDQP